MLSQEERAQRRTEHASDESERELRREEGEEPGGGVERRGDVVRVQVATQRGLVVVQQPRQLVQLDLRHGQAWVWRGGNTTLENERYFDIS